MQLYVNNILVSGILGGCPRFYKDIHRHVMDDTRNSAESQIHGISTVKVDGSLSGTLKFMLNGQDHRSKL